MRCFVLLFLLLIEGWYAGYFSTDFSTKKYFLPVVGAMQKRCHLPVDVGRPCQKRQGGIKTFIAQHK
ncbi:hypothetical protein Y032_0039g65 [Ancylostoma ceylanicum]|uniref:Uncharacterized protein n=1 Tax=Ancylostoma ceylanicum TaxID=53326 RepID=A0A016UJ61_9BILA|nr:hypothetical protein Y032_0039g65 [Ancylostoma ceylanicum]